MVTKNGVPYVVDLVHESKWHIKCPEWMQPKMFTVHNTDNEMDAKSEITYMKNNNNETSYHVAADEKEVRQGLPFNRNGWHAGDGYNGYGNRNTVGWEICRNYDRKRNTTNLLEPLRGYYTKAEQNTIKALPQVAIELGIVCSIHTIKKHQDWSGKWCPSKILNEGRWWAVQAAIIAEYIRLTDRHVAGAVTPEPSAPPAKPASGIVKKYAEEAIFVPDDTILVRNKPSTSGTHVATYKAGESVTYHTIHMGNGYVWLQYDRGNGQQGYIPCRTYANGAPGALWGVIKDVPKEPAPKPSAPAGIVKRYAESGTFYPNDNILARNAPSTSAAHVATYKAGESVTYHTVHIGNGYVWLQYTRAGGKGEGYIPCRTYSNGKPGTLWGRIA